MPNYRSGDQITAESYKYLLQKYIGRYFTNGTNINGTVMTSENGLTHYNTGSGDEAHTTTWAKAKLDSTVPWRGDIADASLLFTKLKDVMRQFANFRKVYIRIFFDRNGNIEHNYSDDNDTTAENVKDKATWAFVDSGTEIVNDGYKPQRMEHRSKNQNSLPSVVIKEYAPGQRGTTEDQDNVKVISNHQYSIDVNYPIPSLRGKALTVNTGENVLRQWGAIFMNNTRLNNPLYYDIYMCHTNCYSSCHGSRGRR